MRSLTRIDLDQPREGYRSFITAWLVRDDDIAYVVDCGPTSTIDRVVEATRAAGVETLDAVLLTHIHLDHGGGVGDLVRKFPVRRVVCHPRGAPHLVAPERLWKGSLLTLGDVAEMFGPLAPVPEEIIVTDSAEVPGLDVATIETPGHAPHHVCYIDGERIFLGEVIGTHLATAAGPYLRPATPPRFRYDIADASIARVRGLTPRPRTLVYGHFDRVDDTGLATIDAARWQLAHWLVRIADQGLDDRPEGAALDAWVRDMAATDPFFAPALDLDADIRAREHHFYGNTIDGMLGYLADAPDLSAARALGESPPPEH